MKITKSLKVFMFLAVSVVGLNACNDTKDILGKPIISDISPKNGSELGGTLVTLTGENFKTNATIQIGGTDCTSETVTSATTTTCITGAKSVTADTAFDVELTNPDGDSDTLEKSYTYNNL